MIRYLGRLVVAFSLFAGAAYAASEIKDNRDNRVYRVSQSGVLNWSLVNLSYQEGASLVVKGKSFYAPQAWAKACPDSSRIPTEAEWDAFIKDNFVGARKKQNMKSFVGVAQGYYEMAEEPVQKEPAKKESAKKEIAQKQGVQKENSPKEIPPKEALQKDDKPKENKLIAPDVAFFAVTGDGKSAMMFDLTRGTSKLVPINPTSAVPVRCVSNRDLLEEKNISRKDMIFTDSRDGQKYKVEVRDSTKVWMKQNLKYRLSSAKQCFLEDTVFCKKHGRFYSYNEALKVCPPGWHLPDDGEWRDYQKDQSKLDWDNLGRGGCRDWDEYCDETFTGHYWSRTSIKKKTGRSWEFRRQAHSINRTDESAQKGLYVRCVTDLQ